MSDTSDQNNIHGLYTSRPPTNAQLPEKARLPYQAVEMVHSGEPYCLRLYLPNGKIELIPYGLFLRGQSFGPRDLGLLFTIGAFFIEGENLLVPLESSNKGSFTLLDALQLRRAWALQFFDPDRHMEPAEGEPVIYNIKFETAASLQGR